MWWCLAAYVNRYQCSDFDQLEDIRASFFIDGVFSKLVRFTVAVIRAFLNLPARCTA